MRLPRVVEAAIGRTTLHRVEPLKGGYSRQMLAVDLRDATGRIHELVLCLDAPEGVVKSGEQTLDRVGEGKLLRSLCAAGLPTPDALAWGDSRSDLDRPFVLMERVAGAVEVGPLVRNPTFVARHRILAGQMAEMLAAVHAAHPPDGLLKASESPAEEEIERWKRALEATPDVQPPACEAILAWLDQNPPQRCSRPVLVHGDFRTGNLMYDHTGFVSVLDWEMAHLGDPLEDVAWAQLVCWQLGTGKVGGLVDRSVWVNRYERASGRRVDDSSLRFWEVLGSLKMAILAGRAMEVATDGKEQALLGQLRSDLDREMARQILP